MNILIPYKPVPDLVEELSINDDGNALDTDWITLTINEFDDHALEQALLLKERHGYKITVLALDVEGVDDILFSAAAKGVDQVVKLTGDFEEGINNHAIARAYTSAIKEMAADLILTGVQAHDDLDGSIGPLIGAYLDIPYVGYVAGISTSENKAIIRKEYPGGLNAEMEVTLPAVIGIQAAEESPRYVAFSKIRQAQKTFNIEEQLASELDLSGSVDVSRMFQPEAGERATMIEGDEEEIAQRLIEIFNDIGIM
jgi:electron transfer flavoprotein beta subunit